jgi:hypothetical protein
LHGRELAPAGAHGYHQGMRGPRWRSRWLSTGLSAALLALLALNVPFYAGGTPVEGFRWRMEHGCLSLLRSDVVRLQSFWVAGNTEGLRWTPRVRIHDSDHWRVILPLWMPLVAALAWCAWSWRRTGPHSSNREATSST